MNALVTGELNYQGGDRNTFYGGTGFPFQTEQARFTMSNGGLPQVTNAVPTDVLFTRDALLSVFPRNLVYFVTGRHAGLLPYFFPGLVSAFLLLRRPRQGAAFQWLTAGGIVLGSLVLMLYMPYTYSGGGGPVGNRYFMGFYALFLFLAPEIPATLTAVATALVGGLFTAQLLVNPFYTSFHPAEHPKSGPFRLLPVELTLLNDLPVNVTPSRVKQPLGGEPPVSAYFLDDNAYGREGQWFWVRGASRAELILRAPIRSSGNDVVESLRIERLKVELRSGDVSNTVIIRTDADRSRVDLSPQQSTVAMLKMPRGVPYRPYPGLPTNYVYLVSISSETGFVPMFSSGTRDHRYLGVMVRVEPVYSN